jgi:hypothetical protein
MKTKTLVATVLVLALAVFGSAALAQCVAPDNGLGTIDLPPQCPFNLTQGKMEIVNGLPAGTTIQIIPVFQSFSNIARAPGGSLCGEIHAFDTLVELTMTGTGALQQFSRTLQGTATTVVHAEPHQPGRGHGHWHTEMVSMDLRIFGDPDFDTFVIRAGNGFDLPGPGQTTLTRLPTGNFTVDSFFDVSYEIDFQGAPGSALEGLGGTTAGQVRMQQGQTPPPNPFFGLNHQPVEGATLSLNADGSLLVSNLGSSGCDGVSIDMGDGSQGLTATVDFGPAGSLSPGSEFTVDSFFDVTYRVYEIGNGQAALAMDVPGCTPSSVRVELLNNGAVVDSKEYDHSALNRNGQLVISNIGSSGQDGVRFRLGDGNFNVDSFFDIAYKVDPGTHFPGCPPVAADQIRIIPLDGCLSQIQSHDHHGHPTILKTPANLRHRGHKTVLKAASPNGPGGANSFTITDEALGLFGGTPHTALGNGHLTISNIGSSGQDGVLVVSNIGSSGQDGVRIEVSNIGSSGQDGVNVEVDLGPAGGLIPNSQFIVDSFFDVTYRIDGLNTGQGAVSVQTGVCSFESLTVEAILDGVVMDKVTLPFDDPAVQNGDHLVISNIGSSGQDGVRFVAPPDHEPFVFYDIILFAVDPGTTILDHALVAANQLRLTLNNVDTTCPADNSSINLRASGMNQFAVLGNPKCGDADHPAPVGDHNFDCSVNLFDLQIFASRWLTTVPL